MPIAPANSLVDTAHFYLDSDQSNGLMMVGKRFVQHVEIATDAPLRPSAFHGSTETAFDRLNVRWIRNVVLGHPLAGQACAVNLAVL